MSDNKNSLEQLKGEARFFSILPARNRDFRRVE